MYESFYGLKEKPFRLAAAPGFLYLSSNHQQALTFLEYGLLGDAGIVLLTGEAGLGKTTLIRHILASLDQMAEHLLPAVVFNTSHNQAAEVVSIVLQAFGLTPETDKTQALHQLFFFLRAMYRNGKKPWLIIDEAQNLSREALEEVRMFSNLQSEDQILLKILLAGQPDLRSRLKQPDMISFAQRIAVQYNLEPLTAQETVEYIRHRLKTTGSSSGDIFDPEAMDLIHQASGGIPRTINLLCDAALVYGFGYELERIGRPVIEKVIEDKGGMGLAAGSEGKTEGGGETGNGFQAGLNALGDQILKLQHRLETRIGEIDQRAENFKKDLILRLSQLLVAERKRSDALLVSYTNLRAKYLDLTKSRTGETPTEK